MDNNLQNVLELSRTPMLALRGGSLIMMNFAAHELFPDLEPGMGAHDVIPDHIFQEQAESFLSSGVIRGKSCSVSALRDGDVLLLSLSESRSASEMRGCLSDNLLNGMLSSLFSIRLAAEHLEKLLDLSAPEVKKYFSILNHNYYALNRRLSNLNLARALCEGAALMVPRYTDLVAMCADAVSTINLLTSPDKARVEFVCAHENVSACVDAPKVEQLILNLLSNALMHTPPSGTVRLRLSLQGENAILTVDDSGCGISPEKLSTVFSAYENRFNERSFSTTDTGGLGLGICRGIAELHGGALILESRCGEGTCVRALLPLLPENAPPLRSEAPEYANGGMNVLLTELCDILDYSAYAPAYLD